MAGRFGAVDSVDSEFNYGEAAKTTQIEAGQSQVDE
jgi:hypothetical protein